MPTATLMSTSGSGWSSTTARAVEWPEVTERLRRGGWCWLSTVRPDGAPHCVPVFAVWADTVAFVPMNAGSRKFRDLESEARCTVTHDAGDLHIVIEGRAERATGDTLRDASQAFADVIDWPTTVRADDRLDAPFGAPTSGGPPYTVMAVTPRRAFTFPTGEDEFAPTRFSFAAGS